MPRLWTRAYPWCLFPPPTLRLPVRTEAQAQLEGVGIAPPETSSEDEPRVGKAGVKRPRVPATQRSVDGLLRSWELRGEDHISSHRRSQSWREATGVVWGQTQGDHPREEQGLRAGVSLRD